MDAITDGQRAIHCPWHSEPDLVMAMLDQRVGLELIDDLATRYPVLSDFYILAQASKDMSAAIQSSPFLYHEEAWKITSLIPIEELAELRQWATAADDNLAKWVTKLFSLYDQLVLCDKCKLYRTSDNLEPIGSKHYCQKVAVKSFHTTTTGSLIDGCSKQVHITTANKQWLDHDGQCPICFNPPGRNCAELKHNLDQEVVSAICPKCRIEIFRSPKELTGSTLPGYIERMIHYSPPSSDPPIY